MYLSCVIRERGMMLFGNRGTYISYARDICYRICVYKHRELLYILLIGEKLSRNQKKKLVKEEYITFIKSLLN